MKTHTVGVLGAGVMGIGVAQALAQTNHKVILVDKASDILVRAEQSIRQNTRLMRLFESQKQAADTDAVMSRIKFTTDYETLADVPIVIENVTEKWDIKKPVYQRIDRICHDACVFAVNTSAISITRIASVTTRAPQVIGMHFMNPVPMKPMVEVIRGYHTSEATISTAKTLVAGMGKECIIVNDSPGFVTNRVMMLTINEAIFMIQEHVASVEEVDRLFKQCFGHKMGPLETADLIGLDTILLSIEVLYDSFNDSKYRPCPLLKTMVDAGLCGRKSGRGFYTYQLDNANHSSTQEIITWRQPQ
jgi:3-hydroxybutyryl-CoA dehydrogenase